MERIISVRFSKEDLKIKFKNSFIPDEEIIVLHIDIQLNSIIKYRKSLILVSN